MVFQNGGLLREVCNSEVSCSRFALALLLSFGGLPREGSNSERSLWHRIAHLSRQTAVCPTCLKASNLRMAVCFERGAIPKHLRCLRIAPLSRQTAILTEIPKYRDTETARYRDIEIPLWLWLWLRVPPPPQVKKKGNFLLRVTIRN